MDAVRDTTFTKIFVGGLNYNTTDEKLRDFFLQFGAIREAVVIMDRLTGKSKGYGFVTMETIDAAERACKEPNPIIDGRKANVNLAYLGAKPRATTVPASPRYQPYMNTTGLPVSSPTPQVGQVAQAQVGAWYGSPSAVYPTAYLQQPAAAAAIRAYSPTVIQPQLNAYFPGYSYSQLQQAAYLQQCAALGTQVQPVTMTTPEDQVAVGLTVQEAQ